MTESFLEDSACSVAKSCRLLATPWTVAHQAPLSMGFPRQEYCSGFPFSPGDLPDPGIKPTSPAWQVDSLPLNHLGDGWVENDLLFWLLDKDNRHGTVFELMNSEIQDWENYTESVTSDLFCCDENVKYFRVFLLLFWIVTVAIQFVQNIHFQYFKQRFTYYFYRQNSL